MFIMHEYGYIQNRNNGMLNHSARGNVRTMFVKVFPETPLSSASAVARQGVDFVLKGNIIAARFALLCLVSIVLKAHHVVSWLNR